MIIAATRLRVSGSDYCSQGKLLSIEVGPEVASSPHPRQASPFLWHNTSFLTCFSCRDVCVSRITHACVCQVASGWYCSQCLVERCSLNMSCCHFQIKERREKDSAESEKKKEAFKAGRTVGVRMSGGGSRVKRLLALPLPSHVWTDQWSRDV